jgi:hypothetical protein
MREFGGVTLFVAGVALFCGAAGAQQFSPAFVEGPGSTLSQAPRAVVPHSPKLPYGLQLMAKFALLPTLRDTRCMQDSSYDRSGGNGDCGHFFRREGDKCILADIRGPGCIYRFWSANPAGHMKIFFDGEATPRIDCPMESLFQGKVAPFETPLVGQVSGGSYCFFPMPFQKGCRIEVTSPGNLYYHVQYQLYPDGTPIRTFTTELTEADRHALEAVLEQWAHLGTDPKPPVEEPQEATGNGSLAAGASRTLATFSGAGVVTRVQLQVAPAERYTLRQTLLRVTWDDGARPAIEAPVGDFFGAGFGDRRFAALPDAMTDDGYVCYWPMPYRKTARFELVNMGSTALTTIHWNIQSMKLSKPMADVGYFHAQFHRETTVAGRPFTILKVSGRGHYVGEHTDMQGDRGIGFLEGDEKILVDGETFPSIYGTGTEDFYTGGWYFSQGPFNRAYHGCVVKEEEKSRVGAYRYQIQDCVPFQRDINVTIEHGGTNDYPGADYSCVAYWYQTAPEHDWSPIDASQLVPAKMRVADALEAEDLTWLEGKPQVQDDRGLPEEASGGKVALLGAGVHTFQLDVKADDVWTVGLIQPVAPGTERLSSRWWVDEEKVDVGSLNSLPDDGVLDAGERNMAFTTMRMKPGKHSVSIMVPNGKQLYLDYATLTPSRKVKGAIEAESLLDTAQASGKETLSRDDVSYDWSGGSILIWKPEGPGAKVTLPISVPADADYEVSLSFTPQPNGPVVAARIDDHEMAAALDTHADVLNPARVSVQTPIGRVSLKSGAHTLTLSLPAKAGSVPHPELWLDYILLKRSLYANSVAAESLRILEAHDGDATHQEMANWGPGWSSDAQFWFLGTKVGAEATLELPIATAGKYDLSMYYTTAADYGTVQVLVDGKAVGGVTDCYTPSVLPKGKTELGVVELTAGPHRLTFRVTGHDEKSTGYYVGVDAIGLKPVK